MRDTNENKHERSTPATPSAVVTLVISQHDAVRQQLVGYLRKSTNLTVEGQPYTPGAIVRAHPNVVVLDLSQLGRAGLPAAIDEARCVGARLIALASMREPADEAAVRNAGGLYRLKSAGADGLAEIVSDECAARIEPSPITTPAH